MSTQEGLDVGPVPAACRVFNERLQLEADEVFNLHHPGGGRWGDRHELGTLEHASPVSTLASHHAASGKRQAADESAVDVLAVEMPEQPDQRVAE